MAFDNDAKLFDVLANAYHLNSRLQALLGRPQLDSLGQQEAMAISQELSQVFKVSMSMLHSNTVRTVPEIRTGDSSGVIIQAAKDKGERIDNGKVLRCREDGVTRKEITDSPHKDGYQWRKYGQKNIRNCNFMRYYFRCGRDQRCEARKKVQQQDDGYSQGYQQLPPMFEVTYVNEHTCHLLRAIGNNNGDAAARMAASPRTTDRCRVVLGIVDTARDDDGGAVLFDDLSSLFPRIGGSAAQAENETIVSCLADVIRGAAPSPSPSPWPPATEAAGASDLAAAAYGGVPPPMQMQDSGHSPSVAEDGGAMTIDDADFCWDPTTFCAVGDPDEGDQDYQLMDHGDMHVDVARLADTVWVWPGHTSAGAWR